MSEPQRISPLSLLRSRASAPVNLAQGSLEVERAAPVRRSAVDLIKGKKSTSGVSGTATVVRPADVANVRVVDSTKPASEVERIIRLPQVEYGGKDLTSKFALPNARFPFTDASGSKIGGLRPVQSAILEAVEAAGGGIFPVGVGHGKAGAALLSPTALGAEVGIILTTSGTLTQLQRTYAVWRQFFRMAPRMFVLSYDELSSTKNSDLLDRLCAEASNEENVVVVADEAHKIKRPESARTKRILRFFERRPKARFVGLSGTLTSRSLRDFAHLSRLALKDNSPLPLQENWLEAFSETIDVGGRPNERHWGKVEPLHRAFSPEMAYAGALGDDKRRALRVAFSRRLKSAPGVVATDEQAVSCSLIIEPLDLTVPPEVTTLLKQADSGMDPMGVTLPDQAATARQMRHLSAGFYYVWDWPNQIEDIAWTMARKRWFAFVRQELKECAAENYDSELLVFNKIKRELEAGRRDPIHRSLLTWEEQRQKRWSWPDGTEKPFPPTRTVWVDPFLADEVARRALHAKEPTIVWYESRAMQAALRDRGLDVKAAGEEPPKTPKTVALSSRSHSDGLNLQGWSRNLIVEPPSAGDRWEQLLGRTHRPGQEADEVHAQVYQHTLAFAKALIKAREDARYIEDVSGNRQKLNFADFSR